MWSRHLGYSIHCILCILYKMCLNLCIQTVFLLFFVYLCIYNAPSRKHKSIAGVDVDAQAQWYSLVCLGQFWRRLSGWRWSRRFCGGGPECCAGADNAGRSMGWRWNQILFRMGFLKGCKMEMEMDFQQEIPATCCVAFISFIKTYMQWWSGLQIPYPKSSFPPTEKDTLRKAHLIQIMHWQKASYDQCGICDHEMIRFSLWLSCSQREASHDSLQGFAPCWNLSWPEASTKVYQAKDDGRMAIQRMDATIEQGGLVVLTPDPLVPFANSPLDISQRARVSVIHFTLF